jgi:GDP-4-dehydro-6-deoxy-D-mannose reductase
VKVLVTGAAGFAGRWLVRELEEAGHEAVGAPRSDLDVTDAAAFAVFVAAVRPDAIAHLAGISFGPDARRDPDRTFAVNVGGTQSVMAAAAAQRGVAVLVVSSSDVYGAPAPDDLPLPETAPLRADQPYGLSKVGAERVAQDAAWGVPVAIVRPFNHTGAGQRPEFVVPALAERIVRAADRGDPFISAGNVDVRRDFSDVRDIVRAYRLVLERLVAGDLPGGHRVYNVASGRAVAVRDIVAAMAAIVGIEVAIKVDPALVRTNDPAEIRGDASRIAADLGWQPKIPMDVTLQDVMAEARSRSGSRT